MISNLFAAPFVLCALIMLYVSWKFDSDYAPWMVPPVIAAALVYIFSPQINWWWYSRRPPAMSQELQVLLNRFSAYYQQLDEADKKKFRDRLMLFVMGTDWMPMGWPDDEMPPDVKYVVGLHAVMLTFNRPQFLFEKFEKVIVYPRPFPSPRFAYAHASETHQEDGCLIFSAEQVMAAYLEHGKWYQVALHEYARAFFLSYPDEAYPKLDSPDIWAQLEEASGVPKAHIDGVIGIDITQPLPVAIHHYFMYPERFREKMPKEAAAFDSIFGGLYA